MSLKELKAAITPGRIDKEAANYMELGAPEQIERGEQCGGCVFFNYDILKRGPHTCEVVLGDIEFEGICDLYRPSIAREDPDAPMKHGTDDNGRMVGLMTLADLRKTMRTEVYKPTYKPNITKMNGGQYHLLQGDSEEVLKSLPAESVHCVVTSPSYWGPKMQVGEGELGGEAQVSSYIQKLTAVFKETRRVLSDSGSLWIILGDGAHGSFQFSVPDLLQKALVADGWYLQKARRWDRGRTRPDTVLHLTKGESFYSNAGVPDLPLSLQLVGTPTDSSRFNRSRFAQFPIELSEMAISFSCPPNGVVLDTFVGTGTSLVAAIKLGRQGVGIDIDKGELDIAFERLGLGQIMKAGKRRS